MTDRGRLQLLFAIAALAHTGLMCTRVAVPIAALDAGASPFAVGALMAAFALLPAVVGVHSGRWIDRIGTRVPMTACHLLFGVACLAIAWLPLLWVLFLANAAMGLAVSTFQVANTASVGAIGGPQDRSQNYSWMSLTGALASVLGPTLGGVLIDHLAVRGAFLAIAAFPAVALLLIGVAGRAIVSPPRSEPGSKDGGRLLALALHPKRFGVLVIGGAFGLAWDVYSFVVPVHGKAIGLSGTEIGSLLSAFGIAMVIMRGAMPVLVRSVRDWSIASGALVVCTAVFALFPFFDALAVLYTLSFVYGLAHGAVQPVLNSLLYGASPEGRVSELLGLRSAFQNVLHTAAPPVFGLLGTAFGMMPVFLGGAAALGLGTWLTLTRWSRR